MLLLSLLDRNANLLRPVNIVYFRLNIILNRHCVCKIWVVLAGSRSLGNIFWQTTEYICARPIFSITKALSSIRRHASSHGRSLSVHFRGRGSWPPGRGPRLSLSSFECSVAAPMLRCQLFQVQVQHHTRLRTHPFDAGNARCHGETSRSHAASPKSAVRIRGLE